MIRYLAYIGPKTVKRIELTDRTWVEFPRGKPIDILAAGFTKDEGIELLRAGIFKLHEGPGPQSKAQKVAAPFDTSPVPPMEPERNICGCGFIAKNKAGLSAHKRACK